MTEEQEQMVAKVEAIATHLSEAGKLASQLTTDIMVYLEREPEADDGDFLNELETLLEMRKNRKMGVKAEGQMDARVKSMVEISASQGTPAADPFFEVAYVDNEEQGNMMAGEMDEKSDSSMPATFQEAVEAHESVIAEEMAKATPDYQRIHRFQEHRNKLSDAGG